jgi:hypothetical protein
MLRWRERWLFDWYGIVPNASQPAISIQTAGRQCAFNCIPECSMMRQIEVGVLDK